MRLLVCHLTRMQPGFICVAGLDLESGRQIRPVLGRRLRASLARRFGGPFDLGAVVDLGAVTHAGTPPEIEDHRFAVEQVRRLESLTPDAFWNHLRAHARLDPAELFGPALQVAGRTLAVGEGQGNASLGLLGPFTRDVRLLPSANGGPRLQIPVNGAPVALPVTDLRCFDDDFHSARPDALNHLSSLLRRGEPVLLAAGLTRPWQKPDDTAPRHWLQVNNIFPASDPLWN